MELFLLRSLEWQSLSCQVTGTKSISRLAPCETVVCWIWIKKFKLLRTYPLKHSLPPLLWLTLTLWVFFLGVFYIVAYVDGIRVATAHPNKIRFNELNQSNSHSPCLGCISGWLRWQPYLSSLPALLKHQSQTTRWVPHSQLSGWSCLQQPCPSILKYIPRSLEGSSELRNCRSLQRSLAQYDSVINR